MRKVLILVLMSMFFAAMACNKQHENASSPAVSPSEMASPAGEASPMGGNSEASPAGGEVTPAASPT
jgi:hypothetical protein